MPLHIQWYIGDWFFVHGGPDIDFQLTEQADMDSQSGVGFSLGIGGRYRFGPWALSIPVVSHPHRMLACLLAVQPRMVIGLELSSYPLGDGL